MSIIHQHIKNSQSYSTWQLGAHLFSGVCLGPDSQKSKNDLWNQKRNNHSIYHTAIPGALLDTLQYQELYQLTLQYQELYQLTLQYQELY